MWVTVTPDFVARSFSVGRTTSSTSQALAVVRKERDERTQAGLMREQGDRAIGVTDLEGPVARCGLALTRD